MPMITVTAPAGAIEPLAKQRLMKLLSDTLLQWEGADITSACAQAIAWSYYNEVPFDAFFVGGVIATSPRFRIEITTPEGALSDTSRTGLVAQIEKIMRDVTGSVGAGTNHWVLFDEIFEGGWGAAGRIFRRADIVATVRAEEPAPAKA